ncbi:hypothetical protein ACMGE5_10295 [Macrococcus equi]|uniref:hypothetical protein n=1 Tax=Macrococcus equi TaxID=3395462 RepID=UPI0039BE0732
MLQEEKIIEIAPVDTKILEMVERIPRRISSFIKEFAMDQSIGNPRFTRNFSNPKRFYLVYNEELAILYDINQKLIVHETDVTELVDTNHKEIKFELGDSMYEVHMVVRR